MNRLKALKTPDCELLLILFAAGALSGTVYRERAAELLTSISDSISVLFIVILASDASMTGSPLAWLTFSVNTFVFGTAASIEASEILTMGFRDAWRRLLILTTITPLHFLLSAWSLRSAGRIRRIMRGRGHDRRFWLVSFFLMSLAYLVCIGLIYLRIQAPL